MQKIGRKKQKQDRKVIPAVGKKPLAGAKSIQDLLRPDGSSQKKEKANASAGENEQRKVLPGLPAPSLAQLPGDDGVPARGKHGPKPHSHIDGGTHNIDSGQRVSMDEPGHKDGIHNGIHAHEGHHHNGGKHKPQKSSRAPVPVQNRVIHDRHPLPGAAGSDVGPDTQTR